MIFSYGKICCRSACVDGTVESNMLLSMLLCNTSATPTNALLQFSGNVKAMGGDQCQNYTGVQSLN